MKKIILTLTALILLSGCAEYKAENTYCYNSWSGTRFYLDPDIEVAKEMANDKPIYTCQKTVKITNTK